MKEIWKDIENYEGIYQVSNLGRVKSLERKHNPIEKIMTAYVNHSNGYFQIGLKKNKTRTMNKVHRLVALAFLSNPENKKTVNHIDGNKLNNNVENLEWATYSENVTHAYQNKLNHGVGSKGEKNGSAKLTKNDVLEIRSNQCKSLKELAVEYNVSKTTISRIKHRLLWSHI